MQFVYNDGGRADAGFKGSAGDCVTRSIAIATGKSYLEVYNEINDFSKKHERLSRRKRTKSSARNGVYRSLMRRYVRSLGWTWVPTMFIGQGCQVHLREDELPRGRLIVSVSKHVTAVVDRVIHDTYDPSRNGTRCVYGYFTCDDKPT